MKKTMIAIISVMVIVMVIGFIVYLKVVDTDDIKVGIALKVKSPTHLSYQIDKQGIAHEVEVMAETEESTEPSTEPSIVITDEGLPVYNTVDKFYEVMRAEREAQARNWTIGLVIMVLVVIVGVVKFHNSKDSEDIGVEEDLEENTYEDKEEYLEEDTQNALQIGTVEFKVYYEKDIKERIDDLQRLVYINTIAIFILSLTVLGLVHR